MMNPLSPIIKEILAYILGGFVLAGFFYFITLSTKGDAKAMQLYEIRGDTLFVEKKMEKVVGYGGSVKHRTLVFQTADSVLYDVPITQTPRVVVVGMPYMEWIIDYPKLGN